MKKALVIISLIGASSLITAQRNCGTMSHLEKLKSQDPSLENRMQQIEAHTQQFIANQAALRTEETTAVINIPVVVHVIYNTASQNISDAQIQSQIAVLNEDFRRLNADKANTPSGFATTAADAEITFCLATKAPNGTATTGIIRKSTTVTSFLDDDKVKYSSQGGDDAWPAGSYLNLWVCNLGNNLLGYAQFPGGPAATDGVVINYNYFGRGYNTLAPYNKGRTGTHEVGHWLNLRHIWGDASCGDDYVSDTPTQQTSNYGCPTFPHKTCGNTTNGDEFMNYMDYTDDGCMNMFSLGQKSRMQALFSTAGARVGLLSSPGCGSSTTAPVYCSAKGSNTSYEWISNVKVGTINNTTGGSGGYADYTSTSTNLTIGSSNVIKLTPAFSGSSYTEYFKVWIDFNKDKDFNDAGELVLTSAGTTTSVSGTFSVPSTVTTGSTRMRVIMRDGAITGPCDQYTYGETEDYSVNFVSGTSTSPSASTLAIGTGTNSTGNLPYGTYYMDERSQFIITKAELVSAGYTSVNNIIKSLAFNVASLSTQVMNGLTIKIGHTTVSNFGTSTSFATNAMTTVYSANFSAASGWNTHAFTTPFTYNGVDNLVIDICWNNSSYTTDSKVYCTTTADNKVLYYKADIASGGPCGTLSGNLSTARPNVKMVFGNSGGAKTESAVSEFKSGEVIFDLFPNPASSQLTLNYNLINDGPVEIRLYNIMGADVARYDQGTKEAGDHSFTIDLGSSDIANGVYFCTLNISGVSLTKRLVISK